ncbi:SpoIID/LytB domain-containing protein, partial [bacterium]|nr:SpoIID/LytB domain-containing protein [bacterium]
YLYGVMKHEISPAWPREAVKAQAVAARSFALNKKLKNIGKPYDLVATILAQVYGGLSGEDPRSNEAIDETRGEVLTYEGELIAAYYHATCGGETEDVENVWGGRLPYLKSVRCKYCKDSPHYEWEKELSLSDISNALSRKGISEIESIEVYKRSSTERVVELVVEDEFGKHIISGNQFRMALGPNVIRSTYFKMKEKRGRVEFKGRGWGHGVGMCQWGARGMAEKNFSYKEILKHYYTEVKIQKIY